MKTLDYNASLPLNPRASFSVNVPYQETNGSVGATKGPGDQRTRDYVPNAEATKLLTRPSSVVVRKDIMRSPPVRYKEDYINGADMAVKNKNDRGHIIRLAKEMYNEQKKKRADFARAQAMVDAATQAELEHPSTDLAKALRMLQRSKPISKEEAIEQAEAQFYGNTV